jgi:hypothetical protein
MASWPFLHLQARDLWFSSLSTHIFWVSQLKACWSVISALFMRRRTSQFKTTIKSRVAKDAQLSGAELTTARMQSAASWCECFLTP